MPTIDVVDLAGTAVGTVELPPAWFDGDVNVPVMHQVVTAQLAAARAGTHSTRSRGERRGGGRKPWRQKGTGRARHGSIRSPQWQKGGIAHGPKPRDYTQRINKKVKRAALRSALTDRTRSGDVRVVRDLRFEQPRTKAAVAALRALGLEQRRVLVVLDDLDQPTLLSFRNLPPVHVLAVDQLNTYDVLRSDVVMLDERALPLIGTGRRSGGSAGSEASVGTAAPGAAEGPDGEEVPA